MLSRSCSYSIAFSFLQKMDSGERNTADILEVGTNRFGIKYSWGPCSRVTIVPILSKTCREMAS